MKKWMWWLVVGVAVFAAWKFFAPKGSASTETARMARARARTR
tara:strand:+ start:630 stop:758 length:129 start_codon:yes stop_codon:yes gene_type:complete